MLGYVRVCFLCAVQLSEWMDQRDPRGQIYQTSNDGAVAWLDWLRSDEAAMPMAAGGAR